MSLQFCFKFRKWTVWQQMAPKRIKRTPSPQLFVHCPYDQPLLIWALLVCTSKAHVMKWACRSFSLFGQRFPRYGLFWKLPYMGMKIGYWPKFQKLHICCLSTPVGRIWAYFRSTGRRFWDIDRFSKLPYLGMKFVHWPKFQKFTIYCHSTSRGRLELIFVLRTAVSEIHADFQNCNIWAWNLASGQSSRSCSYALSTSGVRNWAHFPSTGSGFGDTGRFSKLLYLGMESGICSRSCITQEVEIELILALKAVVFQLEQF